MRTPRLLAFFFLLSSGGRVYSQITGGMLDPSFDTPGQPFSYFSHPTDVIGSLFAPVASEVTPEGYVYTGFGELMFFIGNPPEPVNQRIKTLFHGYLPCVQYVVRRKGISYEFSLFAADLEGGLQGLPVNFVEVRLRNEENQPRTAFLTSAYRYSPVFNTLERKEYRFIQDFKLIPNKYTKDQTDFNPNWHYAVENGALVRDGRILYLSSGAPPPYQVSLSLADRGFRTYRFFSGEVAGNFNPKLAHGPHTPMGAVTYRVTLQPHRTQALVFKMPLAPIPADSSEARQLREASYGHEFERTMAFWNKLVGERTPFRFPEAKVQYALLANTIFDLLAIDKVEDDYIPNVNKFQYHSYYPTDTALMNVSLDDVGLADIAAKVNLHALKVEPADGSFMIEAGLLESFGHVLWSWGRHYALTGDVHFLRQVYPAVLRSMAWELRVTNEDALGLLPASAVPDDAQLKNCHQTGQDIWALVGIRNAVRMAEAMGKSEDAARFESEYRRFWEAFEKQLTLQTARTGGYIPPSLDRTLLGDDWDNLHTLYPEPVFDAFDGRVTATIRTTRKKYAEGILSYVWPRTVGKNKDGLVFNTTPALHYWHSTDNAENALVRGGPADQKAAVEDLYALLVHTSSTHATQEWGADPWSTRDYTLPSNILPDGSTSAVLIELLRNMLVREYGNELHLFSAVSPNWLEPGKSLMALNAPTGFGPVTAILRADAQGLSLELANQFRKAPERILIHVPWFFEVRHVEVDGRRVQIGNSVVSVPPAARAVTISGRIRPGTPPLSFEGSVENYKREYRRRYEKFLATGKTGP